MNNGNNTFVLQDPITKAYIRQTPDNNWALTLHLEEAVKFATPKYATAYCKEHNSLVTLDVLQVSLSIKKLNPITRLDIVLSRNNHLDATNVGIQGNPSFYFYDKDTKDCYAFCWEKTKWVICDWKGVEGFPSVSFGV